MTDLAAFCPRAQIALRLARPALRLKLEGDAFGMCLAAYDLSALLHEATEDGWLDDLTGTLDALFAVEACIGTCPEQDDFTATLDAWRLEWLAGREAMLARARITSGLPKTDPTPNGEGTAP